MDSTKSACADIQGRDLAANIGIAFHTPNEFFLNAQVEPHVPSFDPTSHLANLQSAAEIETTKSRIVPPFTKASPQELVIFCGSPGAGKSTFFWEVLQPLGYERVNQDILKTVCGLYLSTPFPDFMGSKWSIFCIYHLPQSEFQAETRCSLIAG